jgi:hypothetical protein
MPTHLPIASEPCCHSGRPTGPFELSCAAIGIAATGLAALVDWVCADRTGAVLILLMAGCIIGLMLHGLLSKEIQ